MSTDSPVPPPPPPLPEDTAPPAAEPEARAQLSSSCPACGAQLVYAPGTMQLQCEACGNEVDIQATDAVITERSLTEWTSKNKNLAVANLAAHELKCSNCGASSSTTELATTCQFCGGALVAEQSPAGLVAPEGVIPFHIDKRAARDAFGEWISSRWFAPNALKSVGSTEGLTGSYIPHWTFDAHTETDYTGQRGDYYYTTETRQVSDGKGGTRTETYQQRHTAWHHASGHVQRDFDDVLVVASNALDPKKLDKMGPWQLTEAKPYQEEFLTGYSAVRYDVDPQAGSDTARQEMRSTIDGDVRRDIGGDEQRVSSLDVAYMNATFKLMLFPLWIATYLYGGKTWQVMVNANTGEVVGDRPWSVLKITLAIVSALVVIAVIVAVVLAAKGGG